MGSVEATFALVVLLVIVLVFVGYLVAAVRFVRRHPRPDSPGQAYDMGNSISGFWHYALSKHESTSRGKDPPRPALRLLEGPVLRV